MEEILVEPPSQSTPINFSSTPKVLIVLLVILAMLGFGVGGYLLGLKKQPEIQTVPPSTSLSPKPSPSTLEFESDTELFYRCGEISPEKLNLPGGHWTVIMGPHWSPDCRNIAWSVYNTGTVVIDPNEKSGGAGVKGNAKEGVFVYSEAKKVFTTLSIPAPYNASPVLKGWKDRNTLVIEYATNTLQGRANFLFDITTNTVLSQ